MSRLKSRSACLAAGVVLLVGCGKSEYEAAMQAKMNQLAFASKFLEHLHQQPTEVIERVASLQLPTFIDETVKTYQPGAKDRRGDAVSPGRIQPPFMNLPGFKYCYEMYVDLGGRNNTHPVYCYIASVPVKAQKQATLLGRMKANARRAFPSADWQTINLDTPDGSQLAFKKLSARGSQEFTMNPDGGDVRKVPGQFDLYVHSSPDVHVIVGFRASDEAGSNASVFESASLALGTLTVEALDDGITDS